MNKKDIINEIEKRIVTNVRQMDAHNELRHNDIARSHATIVDELVGLLATINNVTYSTQYNNTWDKYNLWKLD